jgi:hypothetical protein
VLNPKVTIRPAPPYPFLGDVSSAGDGSWSRLPSVSPGMWLVFVFIGVFSGQSLQIYGCHH